MAHIDTPRLEDIEVEYFTEEIETRQLYQFLGRISHLDFTQFKRAQVIYGECYATVQLDRPRGESHQVRFSLDVEISCMARVLGRFVAMLSKVNHLSVHRLCWRESEDTIKTIEWLPLLHIFPAVEVLHVYGRVASNLATVLEDIAEEKVTKVLLVLHSLWLGDGNGLVPLTERFLSLRQLSGRPITVVDTREKFE